MTDEQKIRLSELAAELQVSVRRVQELADMAGVVDMPTSHLSYLTEKQVLMIRMQAAKTPPPGPEPAKKIPAQTEIADETPKVRYFASLASQLQLDNFIPEVKGRDNGVLISPARALEFNEGIFVTSNPNEIAFIRNTQNPEELSSGIFRSGTVREFDTIEEALRFRAEVKASKRIKEVTSEDVSEATFDKVTGGLQSSVMADAKIG